MGKLLRKRAPKAGLPPGTLVHIGERRTEQADVSIIDYDAGACRETSPATIEQCAKLGQAPTVSWINVTGIHDVQLVEQLGQAFNIHPLVLEDVVNTGQRPKFEDYGEYLFIVLKMLYYDAERIEIVAEQVSLILGRTFLITFQEAPGDVFELIRQRIRQGTGRIRQAGSDYLAYALIDAILDNYFVIFEKFGENTEALEDQLIEQPTPGLLQEVHTLRRETVFLRRCSWPLRELISGLERAETPLVNKATRVYLRDLYDHTVQIIDNVEMFRETISGMLEIYLSSASNRMNEVMKVLTIIATIFIPLTFVAGVYGMNFRHMPELEWWWGYPAALAVMGAVVTLMICYFRRRGWL